MGRVLMAEKPFDHESEEVFAGYLDRVGLSYDREVWVDPGNVDFLCARGPTQCSAMLKQLKALPKCPAGLTPIMQFAMIFER